MDKTVYSLCFMCSVRCPIKVTVADGQVKWIEGNPHVPGMEGSLCPKGAAGISFLYDPQRVQSPLIRAGERGEGKWTTVGWDEALDYVAAKLKPILKAHGGKSVALCERVNLATHVTKTFLKAIGSPNHLTHDALCKGSVNTACRIALRPHRRRGRPAVQRRPEHRALRAQHLRGRGGPRGEPAHGGARQRRQADLHRAPASP